MDEQVGGFREHMRRAYKARRNQMKQFIPEGFWKHGKEANKEVLLAFRSLIDKALIRLEDTDQARAEKATRKPPINPETQA